MTDKQIKEVFKNGFYCIEPCPEIKELQAELKRKEQECEELKRELMQYEKDVKDLNYFAIKLKQTLTEIKEIAENAYCLTNGTNKDMAQFAKQILQKISEMEDEQ